MNSNSYGADVQLIMNRIEANLGQDPQVTLECCHALEEKGKDLRSDSLIGIAGYYRAETYYLMNNLRYFYEETLRSMHYLERGSEWYLLAKANNLLGIMSCNRGNLPAAMDFYATGVNICNKRGIDDYQWVLRVNMGTIYQKVEMYKQAIDAFIYGKEYLLAHPDTPGYYEYLTLIDISLGRCHLCRNSLVDLAQVMIEIETDCLPHLQEIPRLLAEGFKAAGYNARGMKKQRDESMEYVKTHITGDIPILDTFDELCLFLGLLLETDNTEEFEKTADLLEELSGKARMAYLKKRVVELKIMYYRKMGRLDEMRDAAVAFFELEETLRDENRLMHINMLEFRNRFKELAKHSQEITRENIELQKKSQTDPLTGLSNRFGLTAYTDEVIGRCIGDEKSLAIEILDIDYFKQYNDNYGHQAGDAAICAVTACMNELAEKGGVFCARYGGDEFVMIYEGYSFEEIRALTNELRQKIMDRNIEHKYSLCMPILTISQGICWGRPRRGSKIWDYLHEADKMLYKVKDRSRNDIEFTIIEE